MKDYPSHGDGGEADLPNGRWVSKEDAQFEAMGTLDELNCVIGWARSASAEVLAELVGPLTQIQREVFSLGSVLFHLREAGEFVDAVGRLEGDIARWSAELGPLKHFILPDGCEPACRLHVARTVCRRAERRVLALRNRDAGAVPGEIVRYMNRLSDWLFIAGRLANARGRVKETLWPIDSDEDPGQT